MKTKVKKGEVRALKTKYICFAILLLELITHPSVCGDQMTSNDLLKPGGAQVPPQNLTRATIVVSKVEHQPKSFSIPLEPQESLSQPGGRGNHQPVTLANCIPALSDRCGSQMTFASRYQAG